MKKKILAGLAAWIFMLGMAGLANANLITNGSFELGNFSQTVNLGGTEVLPAGSTEITDWQVVNHEIAWINDTNTWGGTPSDGSYFLDLTGIYDNSNPGGVAQSITTTIGQEYTFSFDLTNTYDTKDISVLASVGSQSWTAGLTGGNIGTNGGQWQTFSFNFTADSANTLVSIGGIPGSGVYLGLDNVSVDATSVPIPDSAVLFLLGIGLVGLTNNRIKKKKS